MVIEGHQEWISLGVTDLGEGEVFLGHDWLAEHNPDIDRAQSTLSLDRCLC